VSIFTTAAFLRTVAELQPQQITIKGGQPFIFYTVQ
jgi:hypothetical protein